MTCRACEYSNHPGRRYCGACGVALGLPCARCSFLNHGPDKFCGGCGEQLKGEAMVLSIVKGNAESAQHQAAGGSLSTEELEELFQSKTSRSKSGEDMPSHVSQDDIDKLFLS